MQPTEQLNKNWKSIKRFLNFCHYSNKTDLSASKPKIKGIKIPVSCRKYSSIIIVSHYNLFIIAS